MEANSEILGLLRHLGGIIAGVLLTRGWIDEGLVEGVIGLVVGVGVVVLSYYAKQKAKRQKNETAVVALAQPMFTTIPELNEELAKKSLPPVPKTTPVPPLPTPKGE